MDLTFGLFDLISLGTMLGALIGTYWKLSQRMALAEMQVANVEKDVIANKQEYSHAIEVMEGKLERRLDNLSDKIDDLIKAVAKK